MSSEVTASSVESVFKLTTSLRFKKWKIFTLILLLVAYTGAYLVYNCLSVTTPMITKELGYTNEQVRLRTTKHNQMFSYPII